MAIDPTMMNAYLASDPAAVPEEDEAAVAGGEEAAEVQEGAEVRLAKLVVLLEKNIEDVADAIDAIDADVLNDTSTPLEPDDHDIVVDSVTELDSKLQRELETALAEGISDADAAALAEHIADEGLMDEPELLAGWLVRVGQTLSQPAPSEEGEEGDEEAPSPDELEGEEIIEP